MASRFWVGGSGNWSATAHWSATTGGASGVAVPTAFDDVFFDANSFSLAAQKVSLTGSSICKGLDWANAGHNPTFDLANNRLDCSGGVTRFISAMSIASTGGTNLLTLSGTNALTTAGNTIPAVVHMTDSITGIYSLQDDLICDSVSIDGVSLTTNNHNITTTSGFIAESSTVCNFGSSTITTQVHIDLDFSGTDGNNLTASSATFILSNSAGGYFYANLNHVVGTVTLQDSCSIETDGSGGGGCTINTLNLTAGKSYSMHSGSGTIHISSAFNAVGSAGNLITITNLTAQTLSKTSGNVICDYLSLQNSTATGGAMWYAGMNSTNVSGNTGWLFSTPIFPTTTVSAEAFGTLFIYPIYPSLASATNYIGVVKPTTAYVADGGDNASKPQLDSLSITLGSLVVYLSGYSTLTPNTLSNKNRVAFTGLTRSQIAFGAPIKPLTAYIATSTSNKPRTAYQAA